MEQKLKTQIRNILLNVTKQAVLSGKEKNIHLFMNQIPDNLKESGLLSRPELLLRVLMQLMSMHMGNFGTIVEILTDVNNQTTSINELRDLLVATISDIDMEEIWIHIIQTASKVVPSVEPDSPTS
jgi:hypothetical protein